MSDGYVKFNFDNVQTCIANKEETEFIKLFKAEVTNNFKSILKYIQQ